MICVICNVTLEPADVAVSFDAIEQVASLAVPLGLTFPTANASIVVPLPAV